MYRSSGRSWSSYGVARGVEAVEVAEEESEGVAQLAVVVCDALHEVFAGGYVFAEIDARDPEADDFRAERSAMSTGSTPLPSDLDMARPCSSRVQPAVPTLRVGRCAFVLRRRSVSSEVWNQPRYWSPPSM